MEENCRRAERRAEEAEVEMKEKTELSFFKHPTTVRGTTADVTPLAVKPFSAVTRPQLMGH